MIARSSTDCFLLLRLLPGGAARGAAGCSFLPAYPLANTTGHDDKSELTGVVAPSGYECKQQSVGPRRLGGRQGRGYCFARSMRLLAGAKRY